eukprot:scaffold319_cov244-Pinguiococcus_pyrenoidosus.AAC.23
MKRAAHRLVVLAHGYRALPQHGPLRVGPALHMQAALRLIRFSFGGALFVVLRAAGTRRDTLRGVVSKASWSRFGLLLLGNSGLKHKLSVLPLRRSAHVGLLLHASRLPLRWYCDGLLHVVGDVACALSKARG